MFLTALLIASMGFSGLQFRHLASGWPGSALADRAIDEVAPHIERQLARHASPERISDRMATRLTEAPRNWIAIAAIEDIAAQRGIEVPRELAQRRARLHAADTGWIAATGRCADCMWDPKTCDFSAVLLCRAPVDLTPIGDLAGIVREGGNYALGRDVDEVELILSAVGLTAVALAPLTVGTSAAIKGGAGLGKSLWRMERLSPRLAAVFTDAARDGVDWARIASVRNTSGLAALMRPAALRPAVAVAQDIGRMRAALGTRPAMHMLAHADTPAETRRMANAAQAMGARSIGALETLGKSRFLRATRRWADEVWRALAGLLAALTALAGLIVSAASTAAIKRLRHLARRP